MRRRFERGISSGGVAPATADPRASAFEHAYEEHSRGVFGVAYGVLGDPGQAQDVVQDVFLWLWCDGASYDPARGPLGSYLRMLARSRAVDVWREAQVARRASGRLRVLAQADAGRVEEGPGPLVQLRQDSAVVRAALRRLPPAQRQAIVLAYWGGLTADQIATQESAPLGTVKSRIRLGLLRLRDECAPQLSDLPLAA